MSFTDSTYYINEINVPASTYSDLQQYIDRYEKDVLVGLLGYTLYTELMAAYAAFLAAPSTPLPTKWDRLIKGHTYTYGSQTIRWNGLINSDKVSFLSYYVYCQHLKHSQSTLTNTGVTQPKNENSNIVDGIGLFANSWNYFVDLYEQCYFFMNQLPDDYPLDSPCRFKLTNIFGI